MSARGTGGNNSNYRRKSLIGLLFWLIFFIVILLLFIINLPAIRKTLQSTRLVERLTNTPVSSEINLEEPQTDSPVNVITVSPPVSETAIPETPDLLPAAESSETAKDTVPPDEGALSTPENTGAGVETTGTTIPASPTSAGQTAGQSSAEIAAVEQNRSETRERQIFFVKIDNSGMVFTSPVKRRVFVSDSPLLDVLNLLLQGPTESEQKQGLASLIPEGVRIQNARVTGNTAVISFNENFMFNSYGAEGYIAQLRQIVWTATEFPNVYDVQILIEGRRIDFLGESIQIGRPISRDSL